MLLQTLRPSPPLLGLSKKSDHNLKGGKEGEREEGKEGREEERRFEAGGAREGD